MIHISPKHRVVGVPEEPAIANLFPHAKRITLGGNPHLVLPHGYDETRLLRNLGLTVPAPVLSQYNWSGGKPFDVQKKTAALLTTSRRAYVLNAMGTGKSKASLWSYDFLRSIGEARRCLVIAPLSTLNFTWAREVFATIPHCSATVLHGTRAKRLARLEEEHDIYIVNPDGVALIMDALSKRPDIDTLIIDELAMFRNGGAQRTKILTKLAATMKWCWGMTGSPTPNEPTDAWAQARIVTPHTVPTRFTYFRDAVMTKVSQFRYLPKRDAADTVYDALQPAVRFTLDDVVELPEVIERTVDIDLGKKQGQVYEGMRKHAHTMAENKEITAVNAGAALSKLLQISLGYVYTRTREVVALDNELRLEALIDAINATNRKVLVFCPFTHALTGIADKLKKEKIEFAVVDGSTPQGQRSKTFTLFQSTDKLKVIAAHPNTMSHGLTLTTADTIIWFGPTTSLDTFDQANARIRRIGQKSKQQIIMFQSTAVERKIYAKLRQKQNVQNSILELFADASMEA